MPFHNCSVTTVSRAGPRLGDSAMPVHDFVCHADPRFGLLCRSTIWFSMRTHDFSVILFASFRHRVHFGSASFRGVLYTGLSATIISPGFQACDKFPVNLLLALTMLCIALVTPVFTEQHRSSQSTIPHSTATADCAGCSIGLCACWHETY